MQILQAIWEFIHRLLMNRALKSEITDDICVACDSADLVVLAERVYRCNMCGYEGGSGHAQYKQSREHAGYDQLTPQARHRLGVEKLDEAKILMTSGIGDLEGALHASSSDMRSDYQQHDQDKHDDLLAAFRLLTEAEGLIDDASYLLDDPFVGRPDVTDVMKVAMSSMNNIVDFRLLDGGLHRKIQDALSEARQLELWCKRAMTRAQDNPSELGDKADRHTGAW